MNILLTTVLSSIALSCSALSVLPEAGPSAVVYFQPPKPSPRNHNANTQDWDMIYKFISKVGSGFAKSSGIKRSQQESYPPMTAFGSLLYGLSMAAGLALGVTISESPILNAFINGMDYRFMSRRSQLEQSQQRHASMVPVTSKLSDPQVHRFVAPSKDGKDHYHHVVHYHIPYPLSVGALEIARQSYPHISWYGSGLADAHGTGSGGSEKSNSILSGYLGPMYKAPDAIPDKSVHDLQNSFGEDIRRNDRHDFRVFSEAEYFKNLQRKKSQPPHHMSLQAQKPAPQKVASLEDMLFTDSNNPNLLAESPHHQNTEPNLNPSNVTLTS